MKLEQSAGNNAEFMGLLAMFAALMEKLDIMEMKIDETNKIHVESVNMTNKKLHEISEALSNMEAQVSKHIEIVATNTEKIDENYKSLNVKIAENSKTLDDKMAKIYIENLESSNMTNRKLDKMSEALSYVEVHFNKQFEVVETNTEKIEENLKALNNKMVKTYHENLEFSNMTTKKVDEVSEALSHMKLEVNRQFEAVERKDGKMEESLKTLEKIHEENLKSSNKMNKHLHGISDALSHVQIQVPKQFKNLEQKLKTDKIKRPAETYAINLGYLQSPDQKHHLESEFNKVIAKISSNDGVSRKLVFSQRNSCPVLESHKKQLLNGVLGYTRYNKRLICINISTLGFSFDYIDALFSKLPVPENFTEFFFITYENSPNYKKLNKMYDFTYQPLILTDLSEI